MVVRKAEKEHATPTAPVPEHEGIAIGKRCQNQIATTASLPVHGLDTASRR